MFRKNELKKCNHFGKNQLTDGNSISVSGIDKDSKAGKYSNITAKTSTEQPDNCS